MEPPLPDVSLCEISNHSCEFVLYDTARVCLTESNSFWRSISFHGVETLDLLHHHSKSNRIISIILYVVGHVKKKHEVP